MLPVVELRRMTEQEFYARVRPWKTRIVDEFHDCWFARHELPDTLALIEPADLPMNSEFAFRSSLFPLCMPLIHVVDLRRRVPLFAGLHLFQNTYRTPHEDD